LQFRPKNSYEINIKTGCGNKLIKETKNTKFLGLDIDSSLSWKDHVDQIMFKLSEKCYEIKYVKHIYVTGYTMDNLLLIFSFNPTVWHNFVV
jgi:hypothetical protein